LRAHLLPARLRLVHRVRECQGPDGGVRALEEPAARLAGLLRVAAGRRRPPRGDGERLELDAKWHAGREDNRGWEPNAQTRERYGLEFAFPHPCAREAAFYDAPRGGRLDGVGLFDAPPRPLSAPFFFHDQGYARLSLGTANVLS